MTNSTSANSNKPPVIIVHGMWSTSASLSNIREAFESNGYSVSTPNLPLHIPIEEHTPETIKQLAKISITRYVEAIEEVVNRCAEPPILVGHSMGGLISQLVATRCTLSRLILISPAAPAGINAWTLSMARTLGKNLFLFPPGSKQTSLGIKNIRYGIAQTQSASEQQEILSTSTYDSGRVSLEIGLWFLLFKRPTRVDESKINCPIFIISGDKDRITTAKIQYKMKEKYGDKATLRMIPGACHWTLGGTYFSEVCEGIFNWLDASNAVQATDQRSKKATKQVA